MFGNYSKLIGALVGNIVAIALAYAATKIPGLVECVDMNGVPECTALGYSQQEITIGLIAGVNTAFVYWFPANKPKSN